MQSWSDTNRFNQSGYSYPTVFPIASNYEDIYLFLEDTHLAVRREISHREWIWEERQEARQEYLEQQAETKAEREEWN